MQSNILVHEKRARHAAVKNTEKESISTSPEACHKTNWRVCNVKAIMQKTSDN